MEKIQQIVNINNFEEHVLPKTIEINNTKDIFEFDKVLRGLVIENNQQSINDINLIKNEENIQQNYLLFQTSNSNLKGGNDSNFDKFNDELNSLEKTNPNSAVDNQREYIPNGIKHDINCNNNYEHLFNSELNCNSPFKNNLHKSSLIVEELRNDECLLRKSLSAKKDEYIKYDEWDINIEELENNFKKFEEKSK
jgi:hypothetical protein